MFCTAGVLVSRLQGGPSHLEEDDYELFALGWSLSELTVLQPNHLDLEKGLGCRSTCTALYFKWCNPASLQYGTLHYSW